MPILEQIPQAANDIMKLADDLIRWSDDEHNTDIDIFPLSKKMSPEKFYALAENDDYFKDALSYALHCIGSRRFHLAACGLLDKAVVMATLGLYNPAYKNLVKDLRAKDDVDAYRQIRVIEIPRFTKEENE